MEPKKIVPIKSAEALPPTPPEKEPEKAPPTMRFIFKYALILLCVAFVLVLLSFASRQQKLQEEQVQFSVSAMQSIETLQRDNTQFSADLVQAQLEIEALTNRLEAMQASEAASQALLDETRNDMEKTEAEHLAFTKMAENRQQAMDYLWRIEYLVSVRRYTAARELITEMRDAGIQDALPEDKSEGIPGLSPAEEYRRLAKQLSMGE